MNVINVLRKLEGRIVTAVDKLSYGLFVKQYFDEEVSYLSDLLFRKIKREHDREPFNAVVGILNCGRPLAMYLAKKLNVDYYEIRISKNKNNPFSDVFLLQNMFDKGYIVEPFNDDLSDSKVLIVDEDCYSGRTLQLAKKVIGSKNCKTAVLIVLLNESSDRYIPDFYALRNVRRKVYPWSDVNPNHISPLTYVIR